MLGPQGNGGSPRVGQGGQQVTPDMQPAGHGDALICTSSDVRHQPLEAVLLATRPHQLQVPLFQRRYCWGPEQWAKLEADVQTAASSGGKLFVGRVLSFIGPNSPHTLVCDGQQRLVTLTLLLAAVRDLALAEGVAAPEIAAEIDALLFLDSAKREQGALVPTHDDRAPYALALARPGEAPPSSVAVEPGVSAAAAAAAAPPSPAGEGIGECKRFLIERVRASLERHHPATPTSAPAEAAACRAAWAARLAELSRTLRQRVELIVFQLDADVEVHRVFEEIADREKALKTLWNFAIPGMQVSACDLIRNLMMSYVKDESEQARLHVDYWLEMERHATGGSGKSFDLESFFMAFLHSVGFSVGIRPELYAGFRAWLKAVVAEVDSADSAAVGGTIERALQLCLAEAKKWEAHIHTRVPPA
ncbi:hypothetical protein T492DRAFT_1148598 [Pavlovales sp. CCMP2436]|nr:hypothetical protein T492DRAFT_1148598 [Pavlovales sp. CCMP2436]